MNIDRRVADYALQNIPDTVQRGSFNLFRYAIDRGDVRPHILVSSSPAHEIRIPKETK